MEIKEYYEGFSDEKIEEYRREVRDRWGSDALNDSETRVMKLGKEKFNAVQADGKAIFESIAANMDKGAESLEVQELVGKWRDWLENFHHYTDEMALGLGRTYRDDERFAEYYRNIHPELPEFFAKAIEFSCKKK